MSKNPVTSKNFIDAINLCIDNKLSQSNFINFAKIITVNDNYTINAQIIAKGKIRNIITGSVEYKKYPVIYGVPYVLSTKPEIGDNCLLLHLDKNVDTDDNINIANNIKYVKGSSKPHSLNNCVAICGFKNIYENLEATPEDAEKAAEQRPPYDELKAEVEKQGDFFYQELQQTITPSDSWRIDLPPSTTLMICINGVGGYIEDEYVYLTFRVNEYSQGYTETLYSYAYNQAGHLTTYINRDGNGYYLLIGFEQNSGYTTDNISIKVKIYRLM